MADLQDDINKYLSGQLTPAEMNALEKKALNDPFLADALEGMGEILPDSLESDLAVLRASLHSRVHRNVPKILPFWVWPARIAAGLALVALSTFGILRFTGNQPSDDLAIKEEAAPSPQISEDKKVASDSVEEGRQFLSEAAPEEKVEKEPEGKPKAKALKPDPALTTEQPKATDQIASQADASAGELAKEETATREETKDEADKEVIAENKVADIAATQAETEGPQKKSDARRIAADDSERKDALAPSAARAKGFANSKVIRGRVVSDDGAGLPGVNVMIKGTNIGTVTDISGNYQISVAQQAPLLVYSFIGFTSTEVAAGDKTELDVALTQDVSQLSEVVVVGYAISSGTSDIPEPVELANPAGGRKAYKQYLEKSMQYPEQALANNIEGKVTIQFTVESTGQLSEFRVIKGIGHGCDEEVIRLVKQGPKWVPTRRNNDSLRDKVKVRMKFALPKK